MPWPDADDSRPQLSRVALTRWLCISVYGAWIVLLALVLSLPFAPSSRAVTGEWFAIILPYGMALYVWWFVGRLILRSWRRCDRCRQPLFAENGMLDKRTPHHEAKRIAGSYFNATAWAYMRHGTAQCMWCGHRDGDTPEYTVRR